MADIRDRLDVFNRLAPPDGLWDVATEREPRSPETGGPSPRGRVIAAAIAIAVAVASFAFAVRAFRADTSDNEPASPRVKNGVIAFDGYGSDGASGPMLVNPDGTDLRTIPLPPGSDFVTPYEWSPDGSTLALYGQSGDDPNRYAIFTWRDDGSGLKDLTSRAFAQMDIGVVAEPTWSPDGSSIAFDVQSKDPTISGLYVMAADGSDPVKVGNGGFPTWAPDGSRIAFAGGHDPEERDIWSVSPDGAGLTNLTRSPQADDHGPQWSPDGSQISFVRGVAGESQIFGMAPDGSASHAITDRAHQKISGVPTWSPDGSQILFGIEQPDARVQLTVMNADGTGLHPIAGPEWTVPAWSPDGSLISYIARPEVTSGPRPDIYDVYTIRPDGTDMRKITNLRTVSPPGLTWQPIPAG